MAGDRLTLADLLPQRQAADAREMQLAGLGDLAPSLLGFVGSKAEEAVASALQADLLGLVAQAWVKLGALRAAAQASREKKTPQYVLLGEHELDTEAQLKVLVEFAALPGAAAAVAPVTDALSVRVVARFESAGLTIEDGCIVGVEAGRASAKAELRYSSHKLFGSSSDWVPLPGRIRLDPPVAVDRQPA